MKVWKNENPCPTFAEHGFIVLLFVKSFEFYCGRSNHRDRNAHSLLVDGRGDVRLHGAVGHHARMGIDASRTIVGAGHFLGIDVARNAHIDTFL